MFFNIQAKMIDIGVKMILPLEPKLKVGIQTIHREPDNQTGPWQPQIDELVDFVTLIDKTGFDSIWVGDHLSMPLPFFDPFQMLAQAAVVSRRLLLGTGVYLLPLRHPGPVAKQAATLDHLSEGRFLFGVGIGGEFPKEYEVAGVPISERGARLSESIEVVRELWKGKPYKPLTSVNNSAKGRNNQGRITSRNHGGGHKQKYRIIDFYR